MAAVWKKDNTHSSQWDQKNELGCSEQASISSQANLLLWDEENSSRQQCALLQIFYVISKSNRELFNAKMIPLRELRTQQHLLSKYKPGRGGFLQHFIQ